MTIVMFACTLKAYELMQELKEKWGKSHAADRLIEVVKCAACGERTVQKSLGEITGEWFDKADALIFITASGIAVRSIAPYIRHKSTDPAVLVIDETGQFCISLLSGHMGGANELAEEIAGLMKERNTIPVITTATDREEKFAVDDFARRNNLILTDWKTAKEVSARILQGEKIGILVSNRETKKEPFERTLRLVPRTFSVGIGCKKDTPLEKIEKAVEQCFFEEHLLQSAIESLSSIDLKKQEKGILEFCEKRKIPFYTYSAEELKQVAGNFTASGFVSEVTGVDNVCERSAVLTALKSQNTGKQEQAYELIVPKKCYDGVTLAVAERTGRIIF